MSVSDIDTLLVQNMWAQVYDYCVTQGIYFFVLTSVCFLFLKITGYRLTHSELLV